MSASVGTARAGSQKQKDKMTKNERNTSMQHQSQITAKGEAVLNKMQLTQEQLSLAQIVNTNRPEFDPKTVQQLMELTAKGEEDVIIALHDSENDANQAVIILLEGGIEQQGEWQEQGGKRKKKGGTSQKEGSNNVEENIEGRNKDKANKDEKDKEVGPDHQDLPPRRGRRNVGGPPPRLARGRGRDRGNFVDRENRDRGTFVDRENRDRGTFVDRENRDRGSFFDRENRDRNTDFNERGDDRPEFGGGDRGRSRGRGGYGGRRFSGRGRFNNSGDRNFRNYNRFPRFEKLNHMPHHDGPEIDLWTNETAENNTSKDTDWDNWSETGMNEEDQWTGSLDETKVFTPSQMKVLEPEPDPVISEPQVSRGQKVDVESLFIESAKFPKAPDYSKQSGDSYINQFNQAATESIKNTIGIGSSSRPSQPHISLALPQQPVVSTIGLSSFTQSASQVQTGVLSSLPQPGSQLSVSQAMTHLSQMGISSHQSHLGNIGNQHQLGGEQALPTQSRIPSVNLQQQNVPIPASMSSSLQRTKPQKSKLPPPSKIPASAVEMPGHIPHNPQLDLQFGIDFGSDSGSSFGFGSPSEGVAVTSAYSSTTTGTSTVITTHQSQALVSKPSSDGNSMVSGIISSPSAGSAKVQAAIESQQSNGQSAVFHNSGYSPSPPTIESPNLDRETNKVNAPETIPYSSHIEHGSSSVLPQRSVQTHQNLNTGSLSQSKSEVASSYSTANGFAPSSYPSHQKTCSISQTPTYTPTSYTQAPQSSAFQGQYSAGQMGYQGQFANPPNLTQYHPSQVPIYNSAQNQYSSGQSQYALAGSSSLPQMPHANHQSQYSSGVQNNYTSGGQSQYSGYHSSSFPSHPSSQGSLTASNQTSGSNSSMLPSQPNSSFTPQSSTYQSPSAGSSHPRDIQTSSSVISQSGNSVSYPTPLQSSSLKPATYQTNTNYSAQNFSVPPTQLQPSSLTSKLGESLSKMALKDETTDSLQTSQYDHTSTSMTTALTTLSLPTASAASLSTGTTTISSTSTAPSITSTSRIASIPSTSKTPHNLPPGVPLMGQYFMGQSTIPPFYSVQPPLYGYEDMQLLQQRMPLQTGSYYDMSAFSAPAGSTLATARDHQQPPIPSVPFTGHYEPFLPFNTGTSADTSKMARVDAQSPNSASQPQNAHPACTQQPLINFHYGYYYPPLFPGGGLQYPMYPIPPVTNAAAHAGTAPSTQYQKTYPPHVYTAKGYDDVNQAQDFSKTGYGSSPTGSKTSVTRTGSSEITANAYKSHTQAYDRQGFHGGTPPPFNLPIASATQAGPMGAPTTPYATGPFLPIMAHQLHHPMQQETGSSSSRGLNQTGNTTKTGAGKSYGTPYWNT